jgi:hypothetical protein
MATAATARVRRPAEAKLLMVIGLSVLGLGVWKLSTGGVSGVALIVFGCGVFFVGAFFDRIKSWKFGLGGIAGELFDRPRGPEIIATAAKAPDSALAAVMPLLREDVASDIVTVPGSYDGKRLVDPELQFLRQELNVTVFALRRPGDAKWCGGGRVSTTVLTAGTELAVAGEPGDIAHLHRRFDS